MAYAAKRRRGTDTAALSPLAPTIKEILEHRWSAEDGPSTIVDTQMGATPLKRPRRRKSAWACGQVGLKCRSNSGIAGNTRRTLIWAWMFTAKRRPAPQGNTFATAYGIGGHS